VSSAPDTPRDVPPDQIAPAEREAAESAVGPVSRWAIHRRLYDWVLSLAHTKHATWSLAAISFAESSFFPIPPDVLLAPLCLGKRAKAMFFALVTTVSRVAGAVVGYAIGRFAWDLTQNFLYEYIPGFSEEKFHTVETWYDEWGVWVLFIAAFTPIPYKVFTIAGGVFHQALLPFVLASIVGRGLRFFAVAALFWWIGPRAMPLIDRYFNLLCILFALLLVGGFLVIKVLG